MINLLLAIHNHQPVGNFGHVFEEGFKKCYRPILDVFAEFPEVKASFHHSGPLLDWAKEREPEYIKMLVKMIRSGQIEPLGGGYFEPILAVIPPADAAGQIKMMKDFWKKEAGFDVKGIWTTERIWEPSLASLLYDCGVKYTILDDEHFRAAGMTDQFILNHHITERHGKTVSIFASDQTLRYYIPFKFPEDVINHLLYLADKYPGSAITYGDDGEKFGMWPGTHEWVIQKGWLKKFFKLLTENKDKIRTCTLSEFHSKNPPAGTVYLPTCSYHEMGEWAMPAGAIERFEATKQFLTNSGKWDEAKPFVRGGYWDNFLTKYPESNYMHKRMLHVSHRISDLRSQISNDRSRISDLRSQTSNDQSRISDLRSQIADNRSEILDPKSEMVSSASKALYRAQCNCAYWHGLFGGLYLNYLRNAVFQNLLEAENILDRTDVGGRKSEAGCQISEVDIDRDGSSEFIFKNSDIFLVIKPSRGGAMIELSHRPACLNLTNVLARRPEAYHKKSQEQASQAKQNDGGIPSIHDLNKALPSSNPVVYDQCERYSFMDHIWPGNIAPENAASNRDTNTIRLCHLSYDVVSVGGSLVKLSGKKNGLKIDKSFELGERGVRATYGVAWNKPLEHAARFGTELNLTLLAGHDAGRYFLVNGKKELMDHSGVLPGVKKVTLVDEFFKIKLDIEVSREMDLWRYPVYTMSQSESGFDLLYQGSCIIFSALVEGGKDRFEFEIGLKFEKSV